jgi:hypothetical protein
MREFRKELKRKGYSIGCVFRDKRKVGYREKLDVGRLNEREESWEFGVWKELEEEERREIREIMGRFGYKVWNEGSIWISFVKRV